MGETVDRNPLSNVSPKRDRQVKPRFKRGLGLFVTSILAVVVFAMNSTASPLPAAVASPCLGQADPRPVTIDVPTNGTATFGIADLLGSAADLAACSSMAAIDASSFVAHASEGAVAVVPGPRLAMAGWADTGGRDTTQQFVFTPRPGFNGVSQGWEFVIYREDGTGGHVRIGAVKTTFQMKNSVPVANDDAVTVSPHWAGIEIGADRGVLANDVDANGDSLVVYSAGATSYPWGSVHMHNDGSYRVTVTDPHVTGSAEVRYIVWDRVGSTAGADTGILTLAFGDGPAAHDDAVRHSGRLGHGSEPQDHDAP